MKKVVILSLSMHSSKRVTLLSRTQIGDFCALRLRLQKQEKYGFHCLRVITFCSLSPLLEIKRWVHQVSKAKVPVQFISWKKALNRNITNQMSNKQVHV